ncbi:MAG: hypothetical protein IPM91_00615 [Bacteroidetes bacterium]|nr:hypothetical protein [Bacteroidota bacterium]
MRKLLLIWAWLISVSAGTMLLMGCSNFGNDLEDLRLKQRNDAADAKAVLEFERAAAVKAKQMLEWKEFKVAAEQSIKEQSEIIAEYKLSVKGRRRSFDYQVVKKLENLEIKQKTLRNKLIEFNIQKDDWSTFQSSYKKDLDLVIAEVAEFRTKPLIKI